MLISKGNYGDPWPSAYQTENRKVQITASTNPVTQGLRVYFRTFDTDDQSSYESDTNWYDNIGGSGTLSVASGYSGGTEVSHTYVLTDANGLAKVDLQITDYCAGDNYAVTAHAGPSNVFDHKTGNLVAWKRIYTERDQMYRVSSYLSSDFQHDLNSDPDSVTVEDGSKFHEEQWVTIFDNAHSQDVYIWLILNNTLYIEEDITDDYKAGYGTNCRGAAVGSPGDGFYIAEPGQLPEAYGDPADVNGTEGGTFVEFYPINSGSGAVPFMDTFDDYAVSPSVSDFRNVWFQHKNIGNYIWIVGVKRGAGSTSTDWRWGLTWPYLNTSTVNVYTINSIYGEEGPDTTAANQWLLAHELGHQFNLDWTDNQHHDTYCHLGSPTRCVMDYTNDWDPLDPDLSPLNGIVEFCYSNANHLFEVRDALEPR